jgi:CdiI immunity protein
VPPPLPESRLPYRDFPELREFLGGYFHQDCDPDDGVNIREYLQDVSSEHAALLRAELDVLFTFGLDEDQVFALVRNYGCDWSARARGLTTTDWLRSVRERLD